ncbi:GNAT family N-acetyltransferase [Albibacillus kandeliae]|uniref:GNAT family N-acetyltransferase n=1 Tax=Albibacillus kandeliae TaxID=2174228 RepID=UPI002FCD96C0
MILPDGFHEVPPGRVATVTTYLEMREAAPLRPADLPEGCTIRRVEQPDSVWYRELFTRVGGQDWLWFSRLVMEVAQLNAILADPDVHVYTLDRDGTAMGLLELDYRTKGECELAFFGVAPEMTGTTAGRCLMNFAIETVFAQPIERFHLHTCTLDHPRALNFYRRTGFVPTRQEVEVLQDPRLTGNLPIDAGPHIPIFRET